MDFLYGSVMLPMELIYLGILVLLSVVVVSNLAEYCGKSIKLYKYQGVIVVLATIGCICLLVFSYITMSTLVVKDRGEKLIAIVNEIKMYEDKVDIDGNEEDLEKEGVLLNSKIANLKHSVKWSIITTYKLEILDLKEVALP